MYFAQIFLRNLKVFVCQMKSKIVLVLSLFLLSIIYFLYDVYVCTQAFDQKDLASLEPKLNTRDSIQGQSIQICFPNLFLQALSHGLPYKTKVYKDGLPFKTTILGFRSTDKNLDGKQHDYLVEILDLMGKRLLLSYPAVIFPTQSQGNVDLNWSNGRPVVYDLSSYARTKGFEKLKFVIKINPFQGKGLVNNVSLSIDSETGKITGINVYGRAFGGQDLESLSFPGLANPYVLVKYDATFNSNSFLWDDAFVSWFSLNLDPNLITSTLDFWYSLQIQKGPNKGLIPREVRNSNYSLVDENLLEKEINPLSLHPLSSDQVFGPYLLGKVEIELYKKTKDLNRLKKILPYQTNYFNWIETHRKTEKFFARVNQVCPIYSWSNLGSGMDNSPRGGSDSDGLHDSGWFDLAAQQVSLAGDIAQIAMIIKDHDTFNQYDRIHDTLSSSVHTCYFDKKLSLWFDMAPDGSLETQNPTAASFWGIYAGLAGRQELHLIFDQWLNNPQRFGGNPPLPSLPRDHPLFSPDGQYWQGGAWPPLWWVVIYGLKESGLAVESRKLSKEVMATMESVYEDSGSVFEFYAPSLNSQGRPSFGIFNDGQARADFLGWGKLPLYLNEYWK